MILQALVQYYEDLLANGKITRPGWTSAKVSWALELDENGQLMALHPLQQEEKRGKKTVLAPCQLQVPEQVKRSSGVAANFCVITVLTCSALTEKANRSVQCSALPLQRSCILPFYKMFPVRRHRQCGTFL